MNGLIEQTFYYNSGTSSNGKGTTYNLLIRINKILSITASPFDENINTSSSCRQMVGFDNLSNPTQLKLWTFYDRCWGISANLKAY